MFVVDLPSERVSRTTFTTEKSATMISHSGDTTTARTRAAAETRPATMLGVREGTREDGGGGSAHVGAAQVGAGAVRQLGDHVLGEAGVGVGLTDVGTRGCRAGTHL